MGTSVLTQGRDVVPVSRAATQPAFVIRALEEFKALATGHKRLDSIAATDSNYFVDRHMIIAD